MKKEKTIPQKAMALINAEDRFPRETSLALRLGITESYVRMILSGKIEAGKRIAREIDALYKKVAEK